MIETIISIIVKYWVELLLSLVVAGGGFLIKRYFKLEREEQRRTQEKYFNNLTEKIQQENLEVIKSLQAEHKEMNKHSDDNDEMLENQIHLIEKDLNVLLKGILSIQRKEFLAECCKLLDKDHIITLEEWEELDNDHDTYNGLGGNHKGDELFALAKKKFETGLHQ